MSWSPLSILFWSAGKLPEVWEQNARDLTDGKCPWHTLICFCSKDDGKIAPCKFHGKQFDGGRHAASSSTLFFSWSEFSPSLSFIWCRQRSPFFLPPELREVFSSPCPPTQRSTEGGCPQEGGAEGTPKSTATHV